MAHVYNPSYSGGRGQEDCGSKPVLANSLSDLCQKKKKSQKRAGGMAQDLGLEFKPQYHKKQNKTKQKHSEQEDGSSCYYYTAPPSFQVPTAGGSIWTEKSQEQRVVPSGDLDEQIQWSGQWDQ
jgi:hypothetical protein